MTEASSHSFSPFTLVSRSYHEGTKPLPRCMGPARAPDMDLLAEPVSLLELPARLSADRLPPDVRTVGDLLRLDHHVLLRIRNVGRSTVHGIDAAVNELVRAFDTCFELRWSESDERVLLDYSATLCLRALDDRTIEMMIGKALRRATLDELGRTHGLTKGRVGQLIKEGSRIVSHPAREMLIRGTFQRLGRSLRQAYCLDARAILPTRTVMAFMQDRSPRLTQLFGVCSQSHGMEWVWAQMRLVSGDWRLVFTSSGLREALQEAALAAARVAWSREDDIVLSEFVGEMSSRLARTEGHALAGIRACHFTTCLAHELRWEGVDGLRTYVDELAHPRRVKLLIAVMRDLGEPVHFEHLTEHVNRRLPGADHLTPRAVYTQLTSNKDLFARTARGTYALRELGFDDAPRIASFLRDVIMKEERAMHVHELVRIGHTMYGFKEKSIRMTLDMREEFDDMGGGFYFLPETSD